MLSWGLGMWALWHHRRLLPRLVPPIALVVSLLAAICLIVFRRTDDPKDTRVVRRSRNFYGVLKVTERQQNDPDYHRRVEVSGLTIHGVQYMSEAKRRLPTSYYGTETGVSVALQLHQREGETKPVAGGRVGITGLGIGTVAAYGHAGDTYRFYEINPDVIRLARDTDYFTYLADSQANIEVVPGDARMSSSKNSGWARNSSTCWFSMPSAPTPSRLTC